MNCKSLVKPIVCYQAGFGYILGRRQAKAGINLRTCKRSGEFSSLLLSGGTRVACAFGGSGGRTLFAKNAAEILFLFTH